MLFKTELFTWWGCTQADSYMFMQITFVTFLQSVDFHGWCLTSLCFVVYTNTLKVHVYVLLLLFCEHCFSITGYWNGLMWKKTNARLVTLLAEYQQAQQPMTNQSLLSSIACWWICLPCFVSNANMINQLLLWSQVVQWSLCTKVALNVEIMPTSGDPSHWF